MEDEASDSLSASIVGVLATPKSFLPTHQLRKWQRAYKLLESNSEKKGPV
jgi:hypothetical protein